MISALIKRKSKKEDEITSSVFDNILHLPDEMVWEIIKRSCYDNSDLPETVGALVEHVFWPHWDKKNTGNENFVEPDLFLHFKDIDIIIEAKREYNKHKEYQWKKEIIAYYNEDKDYNNKVILLALDGIENENKENIEINRNVIVIYKTRWIRISNVVKKILHEKKNVKDMNIYYIIRTLSIIEEVMIHYGYGKTWIDEIIKKELTFININNSISMLKTMNINVPSLIKNSWFNDILKKDIVINYETVKYLKKIGV